jgi:glycosyltransferase involved in cell wall biosynthesis
VLLDQMAAQGCVIVRDTPGNLAVVADTALVFHDARPEETLAEAYRVAATDENLVATLRTKARTRIREHYDWDVLTDRYVDHFQKLLKGA